MRLDILDGWSRLGEVLVGVRKEPLAAIKDEEAMPLPTKYLGTGKCVGLIISSFLGTVFAGLCWVRLVLMKGRRKLE